MVDIIFSKEVKNSKAPVFLHNESTGENSLCKITRSTWEGAPCELTLEDGRVFRRNDYKAPVDKLGLQLTVVGGWICGEEVIHGFPICDGIRVY